MNSEKVELKNLNKDDLGRVQDWKKNRELTRLMGAHLSNPTLEEVDLWFEKNSTDPLQKLFGIYLSDSNCVGLARLMFIDYKNSMAELGVYIGDIANRGKGYGKDAVNLLLDCAFNELKLNRVFLKVATSNLIAIKTYEKCGFKREGVLRQHFRFEDKFEDMCIMGVLVSERP